MAIQINRPGDDNIIPPTITLAGDRVNSSSGQLEGGGEAITTQEIQQEGLTVTKKGELLFRERIIVELTPDPAFPVQGYTGVKAYNEYPSNAKVVEGPARQTLAHNKKSVTYYTLNGKDPVRTKSNLYTTPFKITHNVSGENTVLKTRTYVRGYKSEVRTVRLRIVKNNNSII